MKPLLLLVCIFLLASLLAAAPAQACTLCSYPRYYTGHYPNYMSMRFGVYGGGDYYHSQYTIFGDYRGGGNRYSYMNRIGYGAKPWWQYNRLVYTRHPFS
ncbi:MAG: hypothetical protein V1743_06125 [Nanoarchaeota archaeon]